MKKLKLLNSQGAVVAEVPATVLNEPAAARELLTRKADNFSGRADSRSNPPSGK